MCANHNHGSIGKNAIDVTILPDGRVKVETGDMQGALHTSAGQFLQVLMQELGVTVESRERIAHVHVDLGAGLAKHLAEHKH